MVAASVEPESETSDPQGEDSQELAPPGVGPQRADPHAAGSSSAAWSFEGREIEVELVPARGFDVGRGFGKSMRISYRPGAVGLIIDARGRPLPLDEEPYVQRELVDDWLYRMTGERGT